MERESPLRYLVALLLLLAVTPGVAEPNTPLEPELIFETREKADSFHLQGSTLTIRSRRGMGTVVVKPSARNWPSLKTLRFEYSDGGGMKVLEGLQIITNSPNLRFSYFDLDQNVVNGAVEVTLPTGLPQNARQLKINWVDFYR